jgi:hypothetical protein
LSGQCLSKRFSVRAEATKHVKAWQRRRNLAKNGIRWKFTQAKAKVKFKLD